MFGSSYLNLVVTTAFVRNAAVNSARLQAVRMSTSTLCHATEGRVPGFRFDTHESGVYRIPPPVGRRRRVIRIPQESSSPLTTLRAFISRIEAEVARPILKAESEEAFFQAVKSHWSVYRDILDAARVLLETSGPALKARVEDAARHSLRVPAKKLAGETAAEEVEFIEATYARATGMVAKVLGREASDRARDFELAREFRTQAAVFQLGALLIELAAHERLGTAASISCSFELARGGALGAYGAVREALELRHPPVEVSEGVGPFDDEEMALARW